MNLLALLVLLFSGLSSAQGFDMSTYALCFQNHAPELRSYGPLGRLGAKKGVCQGVSGIVSAFKENAVFNPGVQAQGPREAKSLLREVLDLYSHASPKKVTVNGYANLQEFCRARRELFLKTAIAFNASIALHEITPLLPQFWSMKGRPIVGEGERLRLHRTVERLRRSLAEGRWPLLLYYSHVVTVFSLEAHPEGVLLGVYDSNMLAPVSYLVRYTQDLPSEGQRMLWEITPKR